MSTVEKIACERSEQIANFNGFQNMQHTAGVVVFLSGCEPVVPEFSKTILLAALYAAYALTQAVYAV